MDILDAISSIFVQQGRSIGTIMPDVVLEEIHRDDLIITDHPVEKGAAISDHAFKRPEEVEMGCGWSNSRAGYEGYAQKVYQELLSLQQSRKPFSISAGKRTYDDMLISSLAITTDAASEYALMVVARCRRMIIAETQTTKLASQNDHAQPQKTAPTVDTGAKQPQAKPSGSIINGTAGFLGLFGKSGCWFPLRSDPGFAPRSDPHVLWCRSYRVGQVFALRVCVFAAVALALKRKLSLPVSTMWQ